MDCGRKTVPDGVQRGFAPGSRHHDRWALMVALGRSDGAHALSLAEQAAWRSRVEEISSELGLCCPDIRFVGGRAVAAASYHPWKDRLKIRRAWIAKAGRDPLVPAVSFLLAHELGHKRDRRLCFARPFVAAIVLLAAIVVMTLFPHLWPRAGAFSAVLAALIATNHWLEFRADDLAADYVGSVDPMATWLQIAPGGSGTGPTHPSDAARVKRQERRLGRRRTVLDFEAAIAGSALGPRERFLTCWRGLAAALAGMLKRPFERRKLVTTILLPLVILLWSANFAVWLSWWAALVPLVFVIGLVVVTWPFVCVLAPGWTLMSPDRRSSLRVVARRSFPGAYELRSYSRWPMTVETKASADEVAWAVVALADQQGVTLLALSASDRLREYYIDKFGFEKASPEVCALLSPAKPRPYLVRKPRVASRAG